MGSRISQKEALQNLERCLQGTKTVIQKHIVDFQKRKKEEKKKKTDLTFPHVNIAPSNAKGT